MKNKSIEERKFNGILITSENYRQILNKEGRKGINFHTKHLKAYLRGDSHFYYGKDLKGLPVLHKV